MPLTFLLPSAPSQCCAGTTTVDRFGFTVCAGCGRSLKWSPDDVDSCVFGTVGDTRSWVTIMVRAHVAARTPSSY